MFPVPPNIPPHLAYAYQVQAEQQQQHAEYAIQRRAEQDAAQALGQIALSGYAQQYGFPRPR